MINKEWLKETVIVTRFSLMKQYLIGAIVGAVVTATILMMGLLK